jgi:light-regulated signal transduction histidine kinase (bacteriophytochrome)
MIQPVGLFGRILIADLDEMDLFATTNLLRRGGYQCTPVRRRGLGLALVQKLTDLHGGSVQVESEVGVGSRFTISLS